jgi:hypothetical protein
MSAEFNGSVPLIGINVLYMLDGLTTKKISTTPSSFLKFF